MHDIILIFCNIYVVHLHLINHVLCRLDDFQF